MFVEGECLKMDVCIVEMVKFMENVFCDVNIVFVNELLLICDWLKINVWELICLVNYYLCVNIL